MSVVRKMAKAGILAIGSEAFTLPFKLIGSVKTMALSLNPRKEEIEEVRRVLRELVERNENTLVIIEEEFLDYFKDIIERSRYLIYPVFLILPGPSRVSVHDPREYYLRKIRGVLGISIELGEGGK